MQALHTGVCDWTGNANRERGQGRVCVAILSKQHELNLGGARTMGGGGGPGPS